MKYLFKFLPLLLMSTFLLACGGDAENEQEETQENTDFTYDFSEKYQLTSVNPPLENADVPMNEIEMTNEDERQIVMGSGSFIDIPENAFVNQDGQLVEGNVKVEYREFKNPTDYLTSGIPMALGADDEGVDVFSSAGMIELRASVNGQEVFPSEENPIIVGMASEQQGDFPLYEFKEGEGWKEVGKPESMFQDQLDSLDAIQIPAKPALIIPNGTYYNITQETVDSKPSLAKYNGHTFTPTDMEQAKKVYAENISDLSIKARGNGRYVVTITQWTRGPVDVPCVRAYKDGEFQKIYNDWQNEWLETLRLQQAIRMAKDSLAKLEKLVLRKFDITSFGILNCDQALRAQYNDYSYTVNGESDFKWNLYCLDYSRFSKYPCTNGKRIGIIPENYYAVFAKYGDEYYVAPVSQTRDAFADNKFTFTLKKINEKIEYKELAQMLFDIDPRE